MSELSDYIKDLLKKGYDAKSIEANLVRYGYNQKDISYAFDEVYRQTTDSNKKTSNIFKGALAGIVIVLFFIFIIIMIRSPDDKVEASVISPATVDVMLPEQNIITGGVVEFDVELYSEDLQQVNLDYGIYRSISNNPLVSDDLKGVVEGSKRISKTLSLEGINPGRYELRASALSVGRVTKDKEEFYVKPRPVEEDIDVNMGGQSDEDGEDDVHDKDVVDDEKEDEEVREDDVGGVGDDVGEGGVDGGDDEQDSRTSDKYSNVPVRQEKVDIQAIIKKGNVDKDGALSMCEDIDNEADKETCFSELAYSLSDSSVCSNIEAAFARDACYTKFALEGDFSVCDKIYDEYQKSVCHAISRTEEGM